MVLVPDSSVKSFFFYKTQVNTKSSPSGAYSDTPPKSHYHLSRGGSLRTQSRHNDLRYNKGRHYKTRSCSSRSYSDPIFHLWVTSSTPGDPTFGCFVDHSAWQLSYYTSTWTVVQKQRQKTTFKSKSTQGIVYSSTARRPC